MSDITLYNGHQRLNWQKAAQLSKCSALAILTILQLICGYISQVLVLKCKKSFNTINLLNLQEIEYCHEIQCHISLLYHGKEG